MNIQGFNKLTLLDYPGCVACTVFTGGCDLRCPFCHNSQLVLAPSFAPIPEEDVFAVLRKRRGTLDGVAVTGGEPLLQPDLADFLGRVRELGFRVKLDTNGTHPDRLASLIERGLVDMVAMDIKNSPERYAATVGIENFDVSSVRASAQLLLGGSLPYEFRTTTVAEFHDEDSFRGIGEFIRGAEKYYIQNFVDSGSLLTDGLHARTPEELRAYAEIVRPYVRFVDVRGI